MSVFCLVEELGCVAVMHFMITCILDTTWQTSASVSGLSSYTHQHHADSPVAKLSIASTLPRCSKLLLMVDCRCKLVPHVMA